MKNSLLLFILILTFIGCQQENDDAKENQDKISEIEVVFDQDKWKAKEGRDYPYRDSLMNSVLYNDSLRKLKMDQILDSLGKPDRQNEDHLYYIIKQTRFFSKTLHQKTLVFKFAEDSTVEWIKVHQ